MPSPHNSDSAASPRHLFGPVAALDTLRLRAKWLAAIRKFFDERGFWEVDTPLLSRDRAIDANLSPFVTQWHAVGESPAVSECGSSRDTFFLQTSPEFAMKRLLAAGADAIYQLGHVFRNGEVGQLHNPEFTMLEWYRVGDTHLDQMNFVEELVTTLLALPQRGGLNLCSLLTLAASTTDTEETCARFARTTYQAAFERQVGVNVLKVPTSDLSRVAADHGIVAPPGLSRDDRDGWLNLLLALLVEDKLGRDRPEFVYDYPATQAALARIRPDDPPVAERFELYINGIEICNGYRELTDANELRQRIRDESKSRTRDGHPPLPDDNLLLAAMDSGLPACAGVALGVDRLFQIALGAASVAEVIAFPFDRA
jgi:lysyl-tRNA synthetase class 2